MQTKDMFMNIRPILLVEIVIILYVTIITNANEIALKLALFAIPFTLGLVFVCILFSENICYNIQTEYTDRVLFVGKQK